MLSGIYFNNFQGFRGHQSARLAPITLIFGPNASGKSSIKRILETMQTAFLDSADRCEESTLPKKLGHLAYGADTSSKRAGEPFGIGLSFSGTVFGESDPMMFIKPLEVKVGIDFETESGGVELQQEIIFAPDVLPQFYGFKFQKRIDKLGEVDLVTLRQALEAVTEQADVASLQDSQALGDLKQRNSSDKPITISITKDDIDREVGKRKEVEERRHRVIEAFNAAQDVVVYSDFLDLQDFELRARHLLALVNIGIDGFFPDSNHHQFFAYCKNNEGVYRLEIENVAGCFTEFLDRNLDSERWEYEGADEELAGLLNSRLSTSNFLLSAARPDNPSWRDGFEDWEDDFGLRVPGKDSVAGAVASSLRMNSEQITKLLVKDLRVIGTNRRTPALETPGDVTELPTAFVQSKMKEMLGTLTDSRYQFQFEHVVEPRLPYNRSTVLDTFTNVALPFEEVGTGLSQLLPILRDLATQGDGLTYIEEPELHLHPRAQSDLMDLVVDTYLENAKSNGIERQFILETHSESMLLRLQKRIRSGDLTNADVAVLFMETVPPRDGESGQGFNKVTELTIDHLGDVIDPFPISFVDLRVRDLF